MQWHQKASRLGDISIYFVYVIMAYCSVTITFLCVCVIWNFSWYSQNDSATYMTTHRVILMKIFVLHPIIYDFINFRYRLYDIFSVWSRKVTSAALCSYDYLLMLYSLHFSRMTCVMHQKVRSEYVSCAF